MAVSTPRRLIAEDASYGKISTPDGSRYESATVELAKNMQQPRLAGQDNEGEDYLQ